MGTINIKIGESIQVYAEKSTYYTVSGSWSITGGSSFSITSRSQRSCTIRGAKAGTSTLNWSGYSNAVYGKLDDGYAFILVESDKKGSGFYTPFIWKYSEETNKTGFISNKVIVCIVFNQKRIIWFVIRIHI